MLKCQKTIFVLILSCDWDSWNNHTASYVCGIVVHNFTNRERCFPVFGDTTAWNVPQYSPIRSQMIKFNGIWINNLVRMAPDMLLNISVTFLPLMYYANVNASFFLFALLFGFDVKWEVRLPLRFY